MKKLLLPLLLAAFLYNCGSSKSVVSTEDNTVITSIDLVNVVDDKVMVTVDPAAFSGDEVFFYIPKTVPGTYSTDNYGQYIEQFSALDYKGNKLPVEAVDMNTWKIRNGRKLDKVSYYVNDTYDIESSQKDVVFSPAGTNILAGENFVLNLHGFVGYFGGQKEVPYELVIQVPEGLSSTTSLKEKPGEVTEGIERFTASRYFEVIDNPILYARENRISFQINEITVTLSVYSPNNLYTAASLEQIMQDMMQAQKAFLGDIDSTEEYNILLYLSTLEDDDAAGFGALEHHTSTVVVFPEQMPKPAMDQAMIDVVSHEFFHIVTPLNVHSNEIHYFDFNDPKMSQHLWMYEGTVEYFANLFQIQQGLIDEEAFYERIMGKIANARAYDDTMSFTTMSENILDDPYKDNYANVYEKGALINMALDIRLRELSGGEKGVLWLMKELSAKYDSETPFEDDELIDEIVSMTYPEIGDFFEAHIVGDTPIDYDEILAKAGLVTKTVQEESGFFLKGDIPYIDVDQSAGDSIYVRKGIELNSFFTDLGAMGGDTIKNIDGTDISLETIRSIIGMSYGWNPEREITMVVQRGDEELTLKGQVGKPTLNVTKLVSSETATASQLQLRENWLKG